MDTRLTRVHFAFAHVSFVPRDFKIILGVFGVTVKLTDHGMQLALAHRLEPALPAAPAVVAVADTAGGTTPFVSGGSTIPRADRVRGASRWGPADTEGADASAAAAAAAAALPPQTFSPAGTAVVPAAGAAADSSEWDVPMELDESTPTVMTLVPHAFVTSASPDPHLNVPGSAPEPAPQDARAAPVTASTSHAAVRASPASVADPDDGSLPASRYSRDRVDPFTHALMKGQLAALGMPCFLSFCSFPCFFSLHLLLQSNFVAFVHSLALSLY